MTAASVARPRVRAILLSVLASLVLAFVALLALSVRSPLKPEERAALLTTQAMARWLDPDFDLPRVRESVTRRRTRSGGVELTYDGLARATLRVTSSVLLEPGQQAAAETFASRVRSALDDAGFSPPQWTSEPCEGPLALGDQGACLRLKENGADAGALVVVRARDKVLVVLSIGGWFADAADARELLRPRVEAMAKLTVLDVLD